MKHTFVNVVVPFEAVHARTVNDALRTFAEPGYGNRPKRAIDVALRRTGIIHFMSITVIDPACPHEGETSGETAPAPGEKAHLVIEMSADGGAAAALTTLASTLHGELNRILNAAHVEPAAALDAWLFEHNHVIGAGWGSTLGQVHGGSPVLGVMRIRREKLLAKRIGNLIQKWRRERHSGWRNGSARQRLDLIRDALWLRGDAKWAFVPEPAPLLCGSPDEKWKKKPPLLNPMIYKAIASIFNTLFWPLYLPLILVSLLILWLTPHYHWREYALLGMFAGIVAGVAVYLRLRYLEKTDPVDDRTPRADRVRELMQHENFCAQNLLASSSRLKPGLLRRLTLRFAFAMVGTGPFVCRPGFLGTNGVIHFARWMRLPGTNQLLFFSNYDNTWESYVADFIADAPTGVTAIWSNCVGFPRTQGLLGQGASDRDRLVRWARRQQHPAYFWFSAYPALTADRIRINAAIRQGLATAESEADASDWLSLFGSAPRPGSTMQVTEIPTLVFGGLSSLRFAACHMFTLGDNVADCKKWLAAAAEKATYGEKQPDQESAVVVAVAADGLRKLGVPEDAIATFPVAFQHGMWPDWRARELGDIGPNAPSEWKWGVTADGKSAPDVLIVVYALTEARRQREENELLGLAAQLGHKCVYTLPLAALRNKYEPDSCGVGSVEPFGFEDGISQPVIRGSPKWNVRGGPHDIVEAGEIVLGYPDNLGVIPPSPSIAAEKDPGHFLPDVGPDPFRQRPEFSCYEGTGRRDLGANGTFLVVRQLQQHVQEFNRWFDEQDESSVIHQLKGFLTADAATGDNPYPRHISLQATPPPLATPRRNPGAYTLAADAVQGSSQPQAGANSNPSTSVQRATFQVAVRNFIGAKLVGRWPDGTSLARHRQQQGTLQLPPTSPDNDFLHGAEDPAGLACPFGAHIRRANPRDARFPGEPGEVATINRHRILRVGRIYGKLDRGKCTVLDPDSEQGLMFMCLNADIERQFEFIQKTWLLNPNLHGLEGEVDPLIGAGPKSFTIPTPTGPVRLKNIPHLVTVIGGGYFFIPGRGVLRYLARDSAPPALQPNAHAAPTPATGRG